MFEVLLTPVVTLWRDMRIANRFRLWRLDANRVTLEEQVRELLGTAISRKETDLIDPTEVLDSADKRAQMEALIADFEALLGRCRDQSVSFLVPMGRELSYRYQETLIVEHLAVLRRFYGRLQD